MSFLFNIPDSLKKTQNAPGNADNGYRGFQRPTTNYADLDDPSDGPPPFAPERRQRLSALQNTSKFSLRRAPDGSILPRPTMPPRTVGSQLRGATRPPARGTLTRAGLIPAGASSRYTLKRSVAGKPDVPQRHPSPTVHSGGSADEAEAVEEEEDTGRGPSSRRAREPTVKFSLNSLFGTTVAKEGGSGSTTGETRGLFGAGRSPSPSGLTRLRDASPSGHTRRREASPLHQAPARAAQPSAAAAGGVGEGRGDRSSARTLTAHDLTGLRSVSDISKQLRKLIGRSCPADFDRYQLLVERDKLLYKLREIKPSFFTKNGSCKDMCPEKERYVRVVQMRVADFEMDMLGDMEPRRMVKEYSRSAADQEEPLEHEMRPPEVLERTMEYLLTDIVDSTIESSPDSSKWYDFLWNRTRAIRKELTQQMILNESAVRLIECCTRMHMFAGFSLSHLRQEEFDPRMNDENLSKCLQSLRHLYEDLAKKEIFVESEAEFRAYDVMLHLTDSNILRQVLSYRRSVRESPAVRLALKLFSAIQSNNYTRFFRLTREQATFSQCCILIRYFGKMRLHAFSTMASAYKRGGLPMDLVVKTLAFESIDQATEMAAEYGLTQFTQDSDGAPVLLPKDFTADAGELTVSASWIDAKRQGRKLSEIFRGGPYRLSIDPDSSPPPTDSFDPSTGTYSYDPVISQYLQRLGSAAPEDPIASQNLARVQQKRAEIVVERPLGAAAAAAASSKPAFGGLSGFGKPPTGAAAAAGGESSAGGFSSFASKSTGIAFGSGLSSFGSVASSTGSSFGGFGGKPAPGFSFASGSTATTDTAADEKKPLFGIKQESDAVAKPKREASEVRQTAEKLLTGVVEEVTKNVVQDTVDEARTAKEKEEEEKREKERIKKEQQEREARAVAERAAAAAAAAKSAEKRRRSVQARLSSCTDYIFKRVFWPSAVREVIDAATKEITREAVQEEKQRIADGIAAYKQRMHSLWLRQFTDQWRAYAKWKKEERQRVRQVLEAIVCRNPFEGIGAQSLKRRLSTPDPDEMEAKRSRRPYENIDPLTALAVIGFMERRQARIARSVVDHWREWAERRARRKWENTWPLNRVCVVPRLRPPSPTDDQENYGGTTSEQNLVTEGGGSAKKQRSRRSIGLYPFLDADDSFLDGRATPLGGATPVREEDERREGRRPGRVSGIFNSTAVPETTAVSAIGFQTFVGRLERSAVSDHDVEYARAMMEQTHWRVGEGARERWRRREAKGPEARRDDWKCHPLVEPGATAPSWRRLFDALNADPEAQGRERAALRALETAAPLTGYDASRADRVWRGTEWTPAPLPPHPWEREEQEERDRVAARNAVIEAQLAESKRLREEAAADRARQDEMLARMGC